MAGLPGTGAYPNLWNLVKLMDTDGKIGIKTLVELLQMTNAPLLDMPWIEGNLPSGNRTVVRTGLPTPIWRRWYQGVPPTKSEYAQIEDACANLEARSQVDVKAARFGGNEKSFRLVESLGHLEAMNQKFMTALMYGDSSIAPTQFNGFSPRFSSLEAANAQNIIDAGGTSNDNCSIWLICWGEHTACGIYPMGSKAGLAHRDLGEIDAYDADGNPYRALADLYDWDCGLTVKDWRYIVRIANIDSAKLASQSGAADLITLMVQALHRVPNLGIVQTGRENPTANGAAPIPLAPNPVFYTNRTVAEMLDVESLAKTGYTLKSGNDVFGRPITFVRGIPVRTCDVLNNGEQTVT